MAIILVLTPDKVYIIDGSCDLFNLIRRSVDILLANIFFAGPTVLRKDHRLALCLYKSWSHNPLF